MDIVDKRGQLTGHRNRSYRRRSKSAIKNIAIHHSATTSGSAEAFARYHVNELGWPGIGYHYVVDKEGKISKCHDLEIVSYHVGNCNSKAVGICMVGDFRTQTLEDPQREATIQLTKMLMDVLDLTIEDVWGHTEFPGYSWKPCPSISMKNFREELAEKIGDRPSGTYRSPNYVEGIRKRTYLSQGDQGNDVKELQKRLDELGFSPGPIDGIFGPLTFDAVQRFQRSSNVLVDGVVGPETREALKEAEKSESLIEQGSPTDEPDEKEEQFTSESRRILQYIKPMMRGEDVREVQLKVGAIVDGIFGPNTEQRVMDFQRSNMLLVDGIVGPMTWKALDKKESEYEVPYRRLISLQSPYMRGEDVKRVQRALDVPVDGIYGPTTERAVRNFQRREGITVDGIIGPQTWGRLFN